MRLAVRQDRSGSLDLNEWRSFIMLGYRADPSNTMAFVEYLQAVVDSDGQL